MDAVEDFAELRKEVQGLVSQLGRVLDAGLVEGSLMDSESVDRQLQQLWQSFFALEQRKSGCLQVAVLALAKSGKSTLLNALLGAALLPSTNVPETARVCRIQAVADGTTPTLTFTDGEGTARTVSGANTIYDTLRMLHAEARQRRHSKADEQPLLLKAPVAALSRFQQAEQVLGLELVDTPGPNEAGQEHLRYSIERLLDSVDCVCYVLDYTKLKTQEEADLLSKLRSLNPALFSRLASRLFFVVSKVDQMDAEADLQPEETRQYVADLLNSQISHPSFQLTPDQVILVSGREALLARLQLQPAVPALDQTTAFLKKAFGRSARVKRSKEEIRHSAEEMLTDSGLPELEDRIFSFLCRNAGTLKLQSTMDQLQLLASQVQNVVAASKAALAQDVTQLQGQIAELQARLDEVSRKFRAVDADAANLEGEVSDLIQSRMHTLRERLFEQITAALDTTDRAAPTSAPAVRSGHWRKVWESAKGIFRSQEQEALADAANDVQLQLSLAQLHMSIQDSMNTEVSDFWHSLEALASEHQTRLFGRLNKALQELSSDIEDTVGSLLSLRLEPSHLRLDPPSAEALHDSMAQLITKGINARVIERTEEEEQAYMERVWHRGGFCQGAYWIHEPRTRKVAKTHVETVFEADLASVKEHFLSMVQQRISTSERYVKAYVHKMVTARVREASAKILEYGQGYEATMSAALAQHRQGEEARAAAAAFAEGRLIAVGQLLASCQAANQRIASVAGGLPIHTHEELHPEHVASDEESGGIVYYTLEDDVADFAAGAALPTAVAADVAEPAAILTVAEASTAAEAASVLPPALLASTAAQPADRTAEEPSSTPDTGVPSASSAAHAADNAGPSTAGAYSAEQLHSTSAEPRQPGPAAVAQQAAPQQHAAEAVPAAAPAVVVAAADAAPAGPVAVNAPLHAAEASGTDSELEGADSAEWALVEDDLEQGLDGERSLHVFT